ncbi:hypothetical protein FA15DRAFT_422420 [Coprinopsis marcescibilis]|uniref:Uncharacterized protein n=1 Tax=Coprinopsis marcescibilis TaxID=230819 RepID=A0A5C3KUI6_COPMA|nr:hypothetical protein FA15DRAFT_422420 [Coprinopsis marcescibilis]
MQLCQFAVESDICSQGKVILKTGSWTICYSFIGCGLISLCIPITFVGFIGLSLAPHISQSWEHLSGIGLKERCDSNSLMKEGYSCELDMSCFQGVG